MRHATGPRYRAVRVQRPTPSPQRRGALGGLAASRAYAMPESSGLGSSSHGPFGINDDSDADRLLAAWSRPELASVAGSARRSYTALPRLAFSGAVREGMLRAVVPAPGHIPRSAGECARPPGADVARGGIR